MRFDTSNPAFLQGAGNKPTITRFVLTEDSGGQLQLSSNGSVIVEYMQGGEKVRNTYPALSDTYVPIPAGIEADVYGAVTAINTDEIPNIFSSLDVSKNIALAELYCNGCTELTSLDVSKNIALAELYCNDCTALTSLDVSKNIALAELYCNGCTELTSLDVSKNTALTYFRCNDCTALTSIDLSKNTALTGLDCSGCTALTSIDLSKNTALTNLYCSGCTGLTSINGIAVNSEVSTEIASVITNATSVDGTVTLRQGDEFNQTIIDAAMDKGWDVQYYQ